jgi:hypothetical protein
MKTYWGVEVEVFLTSALVEGEWLASLPGRFTSRERAPVTHWIGSCMSLRTCLDTVVKRINSVGIALGYGMDDRGSRVPFSAGARDFAPHRHV